MALSDLCADVLAFLDDDPAPRLVRQRLDAMAADAGMYSDRGYGPELDALRGLIATAQASRSTCWSCFAKSCRASTTPGRATSRQKANGKH